MLYKGRFWLSTCFICSSLALRWAEIGLIAHFTTRVLPLRKFRQLVLVSVANASRSVDFENSSEINAFEEWMFFDLVHRRFSEVIATHANSSFRLQLQQSRDQVHCMVIKLLWKIQVHFLNLLVHKVLIVSLERSPSTYQFINYTPQTPQISSVAWALLIKYFWSNIARVHT